MLLRLKITVYNIKIRLSKILKVSLDYNFYTLLTIVSLNKVLVLFLVGRTKNPFIPLSFALLHRTLITLHIHPPLLRC
jgi:hypothetical protein